MRGNNVLSWKAAIQKGLQPGSYPYQPEHVPSAEVTATLDFKIWAKKLMGVSCYFTEVHTGRKFQLTVYCKNATGKYTIDGSMIDFAVCTTGCIYHLSIALHPSGGVILEKAFLP